MNNFYGTLNGNGIPNRGASFGFNQGFYQTPNIPNSTVLLTPEEIAKLSSQSSQFNLNISQEDVLRSKCVHRYPNGNAAFGDPDENDNVVCSICNQEFKLATLTQNEFEDLLKDFIGSLESIKYMYINAPVDIFSEYWAFLAFLKKLPSVHKAAVSSFNNYCNNVEGAINSSRNPYNSVANQYTHMTNPYYNQAYGYGNFGQNLYEANPYMNRPYDPSVQYQQQMAFNQPQQPMMNGQFNPYAQPVNGQPNPYVQPMTNGQPNPYTQPVNGQFQQPLNNQANNPYVQQQPQGQTNTNAQPVATTTQK